MNLNEVFERVAKMISQVNYSEITDKAINMAFEMMMGGIAGVCKKVKKNKDLFKYIEITAESIVDTYTDYFNRRERRKYAKEFGESIKGEIDGLYDEYKRNPEALMKILSIVDENVDLKAIRKEYIKAVKALKELDQWIKNTGKTFKNLLDHIHKRKSIFALY